jgi:hypothetical protein
MFAEEIIINTSRDFRAYFKEVNGRDLTNEEDTLFVNSLKASVAQTLTKNFYSNLGKVLASQDVKIKDLFSFISLFEADLSRITWYSSTARVEANVDFFQNYVSIQKSFFETVANENNLDYEELMALYNDYNGKAILADIDVGFLTDAENEYLSAVGESRQINKKMAINEAYEDFFATNKVK